MNKNQLLQEYQALYERFKSTGKLSRRLHNQAIWLLKTIYNIELENRKFLDEYLKRACKKHYIKVRAKTHKINDIWQASIRKIERQCGYRYDIFNFCDIHNPDGFDILAEPEPEPETKPEPEPEPKNAPRHFIKKAPKNQARKAFSERIKLETIKKSVS